MNIYYLFLLLALLNIPHDVIHTAEQQAETTLENNSLPSNPPPITEESPTNNSLGDMIATYTKQEKISPIKHVQINYKNEDLSNIIHIIAAQKRVNIILPQGANAIKEKVTLSLPEEVSIDELWDHILPTILDTADMSLVPQENFFVIVRNTPNINREPLPLYFGIAPDMLPDNDQRIRYVHYLANMKVSETSETTLTTILKELLPVDATFKVDQVENAIVICAKSNDIKAAMHIINELDFVAFQETMEIIPLRHVSARVVADLFNDQILRTPGLPTDKNRYNLDVRKKNMGSYFPSNVRITALEMRNALVLLGSSQGVNKIRDFINTYIDIEPESGESILHIYKLQYLDAEKFEPVLKRIVESSRPGGSGQSVGQADVAGSPERFFNDVIIKADNPAMSAGQKFYGGNKLVIAARNDDWRQIKKLIEELDSPVPTVLIEILVADLTLTDDRLLGATARNPAKLNLPSDINYQSAPISNIITDNNLNPTTIQANLLRAGSVTTVTPPSTLAGILTPGATAISLNDNDGSTWGLINVAKTFGQTKIISHPHVIATNNQEALVRIGEERLLPGESAGTEAGTAVQKYEKIRAELKITIKPRISPDKTVNLQVTINIDQFTGGSNIAATTPPRITRNIITNANVNNGSILALGGLITTNEITDIKQVPLLGRIPIIGWLFKNESKSISNTTLTVFISPTIIEPRLRNGIGDYTQDYINLAYSYTEEAKLFDSLKDPITRWMFKTNLDPIKSLNSFVAKDEFKTIVREQNDTVAVDLRTNQVTKRERISTIRDVFKNEENPLAKTSKGSKDIQPQDTLVMR